MGMTYINVRPLSHLLFPLLILFVRSFLYPILLLIFRFHLPLSFSV
jgi:hypothetical protein